MAVIRLAWCNQHWKWLVVALIITISGTYGDLAESMLKRSTGVRDSGTIMPGHGGFLDRFDSSVIAFPLVFLFITLLDDLTYFISFAENSY